LEGSRKKKGAITGEVDDPEWGKRGLVKAGTENRKTVQNPKRGRFLNYYETEDGGGGNKAAQKKTVKTGGCNQDGENERSRNKCNWVVEKKIDQGKKSVRGGTVGRKFREGLRTRGEVEIRKH